MRRILTFLVLTTVAVLAQQWEFEVVDSGSTGSYVAIDRTADGTIWLAYATADSHLRLACKDSVWAYEDLDTAVVRPDFQSWPPFSFDIGPGDVIGVVGVGRLAERRDSGWSSEELPMPMSDKALSHNSACRPSLTFKDSLWQGCLGLKADSGWDTNVVFQLSEYTMWFALSRPAWRRNDDCAFMEDGWWSTGGLIDGYDVGLMMRDGGTWRDSAFVIGLDGGGCGFAALTDDSDSIHAFWSAIDPYGTNMLVCDGVWLDSFTSTGAACLDTAGRVQCAWVRSGHLKFVVPRRVTWTVLDAADLAWCDITTDILAQPVIAFCRSDGSVWVAHGVDVVGQSEEPRQPTANSLRPTASVVRNVLFLPRDMGAGHDRNPLGDFGSCPKPALLDISGRKVLDLRPGPNDVSRLASGVYFVRERSAVSVRKVVITK